MKQPDYSSYLIEASVSESEVTNIVRSVSYSGNWIRDARVALSRALPEDTKSCVAVFALGSVARYEASPSSDVDLGVVYLDDLLDEPAAGDIWGASVGALRPLSLTVEEKTFARAWPLSPFLKNIGGREDTNDHLTYRSLLLTEAVWLSGPEVASQVKDQLFKQYATGAASRGKHLTSLSNDLHRYYRTLCVDYRHKVEEAKKPWALRVLKLRHSRKLWHLGNIAAQCTALSADEDHDGTLSETIGDAPLVKILRALQAIGEVQRAQELLRRYDSFLEQIRKPEVRGELSELAHDCRESSTAYTHLRDNAREFQAAAAEVWRALSRHDKYRDHLERFVIL